MTNDIIADPEVCAKLLDFINGKKTGNATLHFKDGRILAWTFAESGQVNPKPDLRTAADLKAEHKI